MADPFGRTLSYMPLSGGAGIATAGPSRVLLQSCNTMRCPTLPAEGELQGSQLPSTRQVWRRLLHCTAIAVAPERRAPMSARDGFTRVMRTPPGWSCQPLQSTWLLPKLRQFT